MAVILCTKCGAQHDENKPCGSSSAASNYYEKDLSQVTVKELSSGDIVFYRPLTANSDTAPSISDKHTETYNQIYETPNFEKIAEVINPFIDRLPTPTSSESVPEKSFSGDMFIDPIEFISADYSTGSDRFRDESPDSFSDLSDFLLPDEMPAKNDKLPEDLSGLTDKISEECKAQVKQEIFEDTFKPVKHEPTLNKAPNAAKEPAGKDELKSSPISAAGWIGIIFLMLIPGLNLLLLIIWACGGCRKKAKASFARAALLVLLILAVIFGVAWFAFGNVIYGAVHNLLVQNGSPSGLTMGIFSTFQNVMKFFGIDMIITPVINM